MPIWGWLILALALGVALEGVIRFIYTDMCWRI